eukprot:TRINITY_DN25_c0_g1_i1.p1 TRINITY_DN25_c0_g1~~TRINITY_DN25_c0_g1_i1.p1  ORF type:complete len:213 (+),score=58.94 TRINITY_DN25_c0_g1_i1:138-776(+)
MNTLKNQKQAAEVISKALAQFKLPSHPLFEKATKKPVAQVISSMRMSEDEALRQEGNDLDAAFSALDNKIRALKMATQGAEKYAKGFDFEAWSEVAPPQWVAAKHRWLQTREAYIEEKFDILPYAEAFAANWTKQYPEVYAYAQQILHEHTQSLPALKALEAEIKEAESGNIDYRHVFAANPEITREIEEELERGDWSETGLPDKDDDDHHH